MTLDDVVGAGDRWIPEGEYSLILARVPILCVDLIPLSSGPDAKVGLIRRDTYDGGTGWCLVGGAVLRDEPVNTALERHLNATLGGDIELDQQTLGFLDVIEYFTEPGLGEFYDPRKHAVSLTYFGECSGPVHVEQNGEAHEFRWFPQEELKDLNFGFRQGEIVNRFLERLSAEDRCSK